MGGQRKTNRNRFYRVWESIKQRCLNPNQKDFKNYGGRGIGISSDWFPFEGFLRDMYGSYLDHVKEFGIGNTFIDRIDNNVGYLKENCRWATRQENNRNKRNLRYFEYKNEKMILPMWAERFKINPFTLSSRVYGYGWSIEKALSTPIKI